MKKIATLGALITLPLLLFIGVMADIASEEKAEYVGSEICKPCHISYVESYEKGVHGIKEDARTPAAKHGCESCHGPGSAHVQSGGGKGVAGIVGLSPRAKYPVEKKNELCLSCHVKGKMSQWHGSTHDRKGLACSDCHSTHTGQPKNLTADTQTELCTRCHKSVKAQLQRPSHHPLREGKMECSDCHNPHGTATEKMIDANSINENCYKCHAEKRGPFLWPHPPVMEDCSACHVAHGSAHDKLLTAKVPYLCQRCHSDSRHPGLLYANNPALADKTVYNAPTTGGPSGTRNLNNRMMYRACQNCHVQIHGSNHPSGKSYGR